MNRVLLVSLCIMAGMGALVLWHVFLDWWIKRKDGKGKK